MATARKVGRLGMAAAGLGIGAAMASLPGIAAADSWSQDVAAAAASPAIGGVPALSTAPTSTLNIDISVNGTDLFHEGTATANSGQGDFAIAIGDHAYAGASGGTGDTAFADGTNAYAVSGGYSSEPGNYDNAIDIGSNSGYEYQSAFAGSSNLDQSDNDYPGSGSYDNAIDIGNNTGEGYDGAFAGSGGILGYDGNGDFDNAVIIGDQAAEHDAAEAISGDYNTATAVGDFNTGGAYAGFGSDNIASVTGGGSSIAEAGGYPSFLPFFFYPLESDVLGNSDVATVFDPFGTVGSSATAGTEEPITGPGDFDLASAFGDGLQPNATGGSFLVDILPSLTQALTTGGTTLSTDFTNLLTALDL
ncbi:hypothetical protein [Mycobacterium sp. M23085]|uniref:hypothetical protein n=1 Tax=Mycobacterium sp. M23085 TaxID=3378087 RepID=UPI003877F550